MNWKKWITDPPEEGQKVLLSLVDSSDDKLRPEHVRAGTYVLLEGKPHWLLPHNERLTLHACFPGDLWHEAPDHLTWETVIHE